MSATAQRPVLKELKCPNCGGPISQFDPSAQTVVCPRCSSYVKLGTGDPEAIGKSRKLPRPPVPVELGKQISIEGTQYMVLGRVMYRGWDDEDSWQWNEWMLGAPDGRMMWLSYDEKGFGLFTKKRFRGEFDVQSSFSLNLGEENVPIRERYPAKIVGAEGELTWRPEAGDRLYMAEGARGGKRYSVQKTNEELEVYSGRGVSEMEIAKSFGDEKWIARVERRERNSENRKLIGGLCILFAFAAIAAAIMLSALGDAIVQDQTIRLTTEGATIPINFERTGRASAVRMELRGAIPVNTFVDVDVNMIAPDGTESYLFSQSFWHETGVDEDGRWVENDYRGSGMFVPLTTGPHQLQVVVDSSTVPDDVSANITIRRGVIVVQWFVGYAIIIGIIGVLFYMSAPTKT
ncbi:MAG: DUF4178 domain-containing protein [Chloroflexota bacterium]